MTSSHDKERLPKALAEARSTWEIRVRMAAAGWRSETMIQPRRRGDGADFQIWFKRDDWHGRLTDVTIRGGYPVADGPAKIDAAAMLSVTRSAASMAARGWLDFPCSVPCQVDDRLVVSTWHTERDFAADGREHWRGRPTEDLPDDLAPLWAHADEDVDGLSSLALRMAALPGATYEDGFSPYPWSTGSHLRRRWAFEHGVSFPEWNGVRTDCVPVRQAVGDISFAMCRHLLEGTRWGMEALLLQYDHGSPSGDLPPCFQPSPLPRMDQERERRRGDILQDPALLAREPEAVAAAAARWEAARLADPVLRRRWCEVTDEIVCMELDYVEALSNASRSS